MKYIVANWKMNLGIRESAALAKHAVHLVQGHETVPHIVLCPSFTALHEVRKILTRTRLFLGAQDVGFERAGAFTGSVGTSQLEDLAVQFVLVGHSERRVHFGETSEMIQAKMRAVFSAGMTPILCVGDNLDSASTIHERRGVVLEQLRQSLLGVSAPRQATLCIAYEPLWAIGSGHAANVDDCIFLFQSIREEALRLMPGIQVAVLYGGSVDAEAAHAFLREPAVDGVLVGGASLRFHEFEQIVRVGCEVVTAQSLV